MRHKYAEVIKAWLDGASIEWRPGPQFEWRDDNSEFPAFENSDYEFRAKPDARPAWQQTLIDAVKEGRTIEWNMGGTEWIESSINGNFNPDDFVFENDPARYRIKPAEKVVRWQWILSPKFNDGYNFLTSEFHTDESVVDLYPYEHFDVLGKAEWTRTEFDK